MSTKNPRLKVLLSSDLYEVLEWIAEQEGKSLR